MWTVSPRFLTALTRGPSFRTACTVTPPGGAALAVTIKSGKLQVNGSQRIRRQVGGFTVVGDSTVYDALATPGSLVRLTCQVKSAGDPIPVFTGEVSEPEQVFGDGSAAMTLLDLANWLSRTTFEAPYVAAAGTLRWQIISTMVTTYRPGTTVNNISSDTSAITAQTTWTTGPLDVIADMAADGGTEAFFLPDGTFIIRDQPLLTTQPVWTAAAGDGGVLESVARKRPLDRLFNKVIAQASATDGSQTWQTTYADLTDTTHPRYRTNVGIVPKKILSPTGTLAEATARCQRELDRVLGSTESLRFGSIANPALEASDSVRLITSKINNEPARIFQQFIDSFSFDLRTFSMDAQTRQQVVTDG